MRSLGVPLFALAACSGHKADAPETKPSSPVTFVPGDANAATPPVSSEPPSGSYGGSANVAADSAPPSRERHPIDVTLRSTPPGALVSVDGNPAGTTPAFWAGYADGRPHEFAFSLDRFETARYRFVPVTSGVIHARLDPIAEERDAGVAPPPAVAPVQPPPVAPPPLPPPVAPADAATAGVGSGSSAGGATGSARGPQP